MRGTLLSIAVVFVIGCGGTHGQSVCDNMVPPPAACMQACDPQPGAPNTCPMGYHCTPDGHCDAVCTPGGNECGDGYHCTNDGQCEGDGACTGLQCNVTHCESMGLPPTTIAGKVFAPNGTLPLYNVTIYVPNSAVGPAPDGAQCNKCSDTLPGDPIVQGVTIEDGTFSLSDVPDGDNIPLVIVSGKWRRVINIPHVEKCGATPTMIPATDTTLPKSMTDMTANTTSVDMPHIALSTGGADSLECLLRKLGIDDKEIGTAGGPQKIHLFSDNSSAGAGVAQFKGGFPGGSGAFADSKNLWDTVDHLKPYDITILSCEGGQFPNTKQQTDMDALKGYADLGGRVFASHWHNIWIEGSTQGGGNQKPAVWPGIATWNNSGNGTATDLIDETNNPKGSSFATWMMNVGGSTVRDQIAIVSGTEKSTCTQVDNTKGERWTYLSGGGGNTQNFQFTTPNEADVNSRCGKVVFSDMHVSGDGNPGGSYPDQGGKPCSTAALTPQEKALAFMIFDLSSCVGALF